MTGARSFAAAPSVMLLCPPSLRGRLVLRLADWSGAATGTLDPGIDLRTPDRARHGPESYTIVSLPVSLFAAYGPLPFTSERQPIDPRRISLAYIITSDDFDSAADGSPEPDSSTNS